MTDYFVIIYIMTKLLTSEEIEARYFNNKQVLSTEFKKTLGLKTITLIINTFNNNYNWISKNISTCKNLNYIGREKNLIKLTDQHSLLYKHPLLMIYNNYKINLHSVITLNDTSDTKIPKINLGSWMDSADRPQYNDNKTWATLGH